MEDDNTFLVTINLPSGTMTIAFQFSPTVSVEAVLTTLRMYYRVTEALLSCSEDRTILATTLTAGSHYYVREFRMLSEVPGKV